MKKFLSILLDIVMILVVVVAILVTVVSLSTNRRGVPHVFGYVPLSIQSDSMANTIRKGDFIMTKDVNPKDLKVGDVISFFATEQDKTIIKTHRITEVVNTGGVLSFATKGDNNKVEDHNTVVETDVISKYTGTRIPVLGSVFDFLKSQVGFLVCIILPLFMMFIYQLYKFIVVVIEEKKKAPVK